MSAINEQPTSMHKMAYESNWNGLAARLDVAPGEGLRPVNDTTWMKQDGECLPEDDILIEASSLTPIHILCTRRNLPVEILEKYLSALPSSTRLLTSDMRTPIHLACYSMQSLAVIEFLARHDPDCLTLSEDFDGWNPFHICVHCGAEEQVMARLLDIVGPKDRREKALSMKDRYGRTPLDLACNVRPKIGTADFALVYRASNLELLDGPPLETLSRNYRTYLTGAIQLKPPPRKLVSTGLPSPFCNPRKTLTVESIWLWRPADSLALWQCMHKALVVLGACDTDVATYPLLHECIRQDPHCRTHMFHCLLSLNPHFSLQSDGNGDLPLHVAASLAERTREWQDRLSFLLVAYPKGASIVNRDGNLPLEILDSRRLSWNHMRPVIRCCPVALSRLDLHESLYAFIISKLGQKGYNSTIFTILKETPSLVENY
jgi:hypothetical protein